MKELANIIIKDLINSGVETFFGIQGGACARLIQAVIINGGKFHPVLNEQAAGYTAHGYYLKTRKTPGMIFTTGPGFTNGLTGIAACYFDRIPSITLVGQVNKKLNVSQKTNTRMVGFQEVNHIGLAKEISTKTFKIDSTLKYKNCRKEIINNLNNTIVVEVNDDVQREKVTRLGKITRSKNIENFNNNKNFNTKKINNLLNGKKKPVCIIGSGLYSEDDYKDQIKKITSLNIPIAVTWGGQRFQHLLKKNFIGLFGRHSYGFANNYLAKSDLIIAFGCSLLQHQIGKEPGNFARNSKIIFVNNDKQESKRASSQFGKRLITTNLRVSEFLKVFSKDISSKDYNFNLLNFAEVNQKLSEKDIHSPVQDLKKIFKDLDDDYIIFSDAGATLSWSYQAANLVKNCPPIYTSYNLHGMGYANCAAIGAASGGKKKILAIIGDGSVPMNSQELAWCKKYNIKFIIIDNKGYGIIRQTQKQFYNSKFFGSDFINKNSKLPFFSVKKILKSYDISYTESQNKKISKSKINWLMSKKNTSALIIKIKYKAIVKEN